MVEIFYSYTNVKYAKQFESHVLNTYFKDKKIEYKTCAYDGIIMLAVSDKEVGISVIKAVNEEEKRLASIKTKQLSVLSYLNEDLDNFEGVWHNGKNLTYNGNDVLINALTSSIDDYVYSVATTYTQIKTLLVT